MALNETERAKLRGVMCDLRSAAEGADPVTTRHALAMAQMVLREVEAGYHERLKAATTAAVLAAAGGKP